MHHENCSYLTILAEIRQAPYRNSARPVRRYSPCPTFKRAKQPPRPYFRSLLGPGTLVSFPAARSQATSSIAHISRPRISSSAAASSDLLFDGPREKAFLSRFLGELAPACRYLPPPTFEAAIEEWRDGERRMLRPSLSRNDRVQDRRSRYAGKPARNSFFGAGRAAGPARLPDTVDQPSPGFFP
jgi:hypothetical protein